MPEIAPFKGTRFSPEHAADAIAPPFDSVGAAMREELYERSPRNVVRLTLPKDRGPEGYRASRAMLEEWISEGVLLRDREELIATLVHETAHRVGADGAVSHERAIEALFAKIVVALS